MAVSCDAPPAAAEVTVIQDLGSGEATPIPSPLNGPERSITLLLETGGSPVLVSSSRSQLGALGGEVRIRSMCHES